MFSTLHRLGFAQGDRFSLNRRRRRIYPTVNWTDLKRKFTLLSALKTDRLNIPEAKF